MAHADNSAAILAQARERSAQRLMMAYVLTGLFFMLLPGTFLGVWNLIAISAQHQNTLSPAWIQAHGQAQVLGWVGTFIIGIGFYSLPKMAGKGTQGGSWGWITLLAWTSAVLLRWAAGVYERHWQVLLPLSAALEFAAFLIFLFSTITAHRSAGARSSDGMPVWILAVLTGTSALGIALLMNLADSIYSAYYAAAPALPAPYDARLLVMLCYGFIVPTIWGFSARWLPVFLGLPPLREGLLRTALALDVAGVLLAQAGLFQISPWLLAAAAVLSVVALNLFVRPARPAKTVGVHGSFPIFVRLAYGWFLVATVLGIAAAYVDHSNGWTGASRHALTVGFVSTMVFSIGQRVLPAFGGMKVLYSPRLMLACLLLLNVGCALRVSSEILAYEGFWSPAWHVLPWSAICELTAVTLFAANLVLTFRQPPAHEMKPLTQLS
ncbi:MAG TPA: NnrS family protein [Candidatus Angelobacter sp.]